jgi:hypothetical protein
MIPLWLVCKLTLYYIQGCFCHFPRYHMSVYYLLLPFTSLPWLVLIWFIKEFSGFHLQHNLWESCFDLVAGYHSRALQVDLMDLMFTLSSCESELGATCGEGRECVEGLSNFMFDPWPEGTVSSWVISLCSLGWWPLLVAGDSCSNFHLTLFFVTPCPNVVDASVLWWECHQFPWLHTSGHLSLNA